MLKKFILTAIIVLGLTFPAMAGQEKVELELYSAAKAGTGAYDHTLTLAQMLNDLHPWLRGSGLETMGTLDMLNTMDKLPPERRKNALGIDAFYSAISVARLGLPPWKRKFEDLKFVSNSLFTSFSFVSYDPDIKSGKDLIGKRVALWPRGSAFNSFGEALLRAWGIYDQVKLSHHSPMDFKEVLQTGTVDAVLVNTGMERADGGLTTSGYLIPLLQAKKSYFVNIPKEDLATVNKQNPWKIWARVTPKGALAGGYPLEDTGVLAVSTGIWCWDTADAGVIYELVKFLDENAAEWTKRTNGDPMGGQHMAEQYPGLTEDMVHPGALKYFKEKNYRIGGEN
jgi:TRAP-type uncharacterized transport system substrate-binding protein